MPGEALYLATLCYADAHNAVADWQLRYKLPLSPVLQSLIMFADKEGAAREGLVLAILLEHSAASFKPTMVAPAWAAVQCRNTGSAHEMFDEEILLYTFASVLDHLSTFLREVSALQAQRRALAAETGKDDPKLPAELRVPFAKLQKGVGFLGTAAYDAARPMQFETPIEQ